MYIPADARAHFIQRQLDCSRLLSAARPGYSGGGRVVIGAEEVKRDVLLLPDYPAVMRDRRNVEQFAGMHLYYLPILEGHGRASRKHQADVLYRASRGADAGTDVLRPTPTWFVGSATNRHPADPHDLESPLLHRADLVRLLEAPEDDGDRIGGRMAGAHDEIAASIWSVRSMTSSSPRIARMGCLDTAVRRGAAAA